MDLTKLIPRRLQGAKELIRILANAFALLLVVQVSGLDLSKYGVNPALDWRATLFVFLLLFAILTWLANHQHDQAPV